MSAERVRMRLGFWRNMQGTRNITARHGEYVSTMPFPFPCASFVAVSFSFSCLFLFPFKKKDTSSYIFILAVRSARWLAAKKTPEQHKDHGWFRRAVWQLGFQHSSVSLLPARGPGPCVMLSSIPSAWII